MLRAHGLLALVLILGLLTPTVGISSQPYYAHAAAARVLTISPNAVIAGSTGVLTVQGSGFAPNSQVALHYDTGTAIGTATSAADGSFSSTVTIPASIVPSAEIGRHQLQAADATGLRASIFLAVVGLRLSTPMAPPGAQVMVGGSGYLPNQPLVMHLGDLLVLAVRTDRSGAFAEHPIFVPTGLTGQQRLEVGSGSAQNLIARTSFLITAASLTLDAATITAGKAVSVRGSGFAALATLRLFLGSAPLGTVTTTAAGAFGPLSLVVPAIVAPGRHSIEISDRGGRSLASVILTVEAPSRPAVATHTAVPTATLRPSQTATHSRPVATIVPTATMRPTPTATRIRPPATAVPTATRIHPVATVVPTATKRPTPTATHPSPAATAVPTPLPAALVISPGTVLAGATIDVGGSRYLPGEQVDIQLTNSTGSGVLHLAYAAAGTSGTFHLRGLGIPITMPSGSYQILAIGLRSARFSRAPLQVRAPRPTLRVLPTTFAPQDTIKVAGTNFLPGEAVTMVLSTRAGTAAVLLGQAATNGSGSFGPIALHVPFGIPAGPLEVVASGQRSNRQALAPVTARIQVPTLASSSSTVRPMDRVTLTGSHFQPGEIVTIDLVALSSSTHLGTVQVTSAGTFILAKITIPLNTPQGSASLLATGTSSHLSAAEQIRVGALPATLNVAPSRVKAGGHFMLSVRGFIPGETIVMQLVGGPIRLTLASAVAGTGGAVTIAVVTMPAYVPAAAYSIVVFGQTSGRSTSARLVVTALPPAAPILSMLTSAGGTLARLSPGSLAQIAGSHFPPGSTVTLALVGGGRKIVLGAVVIAANGTFGPVGLTVPASTSAGAYHAQSWIGGKVVAAVALQVAILNPTLHVAPASVKPGSVITIFGNGFAAGEQVVLALNGAALGSIPGTVLTNSSGAFVVTAVVPGTLNAGVNSLTAIGTSSRAGLSIGLQGTLPLASRWYLPNGDTTGGHQTVLALLNPSNGVARVTLTFLYQNAPEQHTTLLIPAHARGSVDLALVAGVGRYISTIVEADRQIGAESTINYGNGDTSTALGADAPATRWYLAEGFTGNSFSEALVVMNPNTGFAVVDVRFLPFNGKVPQEVRFVVPPRAAIRLNVNQYMPGLSVSSIVTADKGVVVERSMRFGQAGRGAHDQIGMTNASTIWLLSQVDSSPDRQTFLTILNPNQAAPAAVTATFFGADGHVAGARTIVVDPLHRGNIKVNDVLPNAAAAVMVTSNVPVVVERPQYEGPADLNKARSGSDVFGRNGGAGAWLFPGGSIGAGIQGRFYLYNPGLRPVSIRIILYAANGAMEQRSVTVAPNSSGSLDVASIGGLPAGPVGARLQSTNGQVFLAERFEVNVAFQTASSTQGLAQ